MKILTLLAMILLTGCIFEPKDNTKVNDAEYLYSIYTLTGNYQYGYSTKLGHKVTVNDETHTLYYVSSIKLTTVNGKPKSYTIKTQLDTFERQCYEKYEYQWKVK
jgi:starvation-inducible outer membrane lipoprotein